MKDAEFTSYTIIEFPSEAEMEFFLSERISKSASLRDRMKKSGMKKWVTSRIFNKDNKFVIANWLEYESQEAYESCNSMIVATPSSFHARQASCCRMSIRHH